MPHKKEYDREEKRTVEAVVKSVLESKKFDPQGSYTGHPADGGKPQQDADFRDALLKILSRDRSGEALK